MTDKWSLELYWSFRYYYIDTRVAAFVKMSILGFFLTDRFVSNFPSFHMVLPLLIRLAQWPSSDYPSQPAHPHMVFSAALILLQQNNSNGHQLAIYLFNKGCRFGRNNNVPVRLWNNYLHVLVLYYFCVWFQAVKNYVNKLCQKI